VASQQGLPNKIENDEVCEIELALSILAEA
jgi:hypothetical protein